MDATLRNFVRQRAQHRCEYCHIRQEYEPFYRFHIAHITPRILCGSDDDNNLVLACHHCNLHKGLEQAAVDPLSGQIVPLFNPRHPDWPEHFAIADLLVVGLTPTGRATVQLLRMNATPRLELRRDAQL
jgi:hypothetical protein